MKSIITRYSQIKEKGFNEEDATNINMVTKALKAAGIVADDGTGQLKAFDQVIDELGGKWGILDAKTRSYIATQMAGIYQGNRFKALMNDYSRSIELYEGSLNSAGVANQKFAIYQESTASKIDKLKASMEGFWQRSLDAESFKFIIEALTALVNSMENLTQVLSFATAALLLYKSGFLGTIPAMLGFTAASTTATATATAAGVAATGAATAFTAMQVAMGVFGLIALAVGAAITAFDIFNESAQETAQKIADINSEIEKMDVNIDSVGRLAKEFDELNKKSQLSKLSTDDLERFRDIQNQLAEIMPDVVDSYDAEGNAIIANSGVIDEYIKKLKEVRNLKLGENTDSYVRQIEEETKKRNQAMVMLEVNKERSKNALFSPEEDIKENTKQINEASDAIKNLHKSLLETIPDFSKLEGISKRMAEVLIENMTKGEFGGKINSSNIELYATRIGEISKKIEEGNIPEKIKQYNELSLSYQQGNGTLTEVSEAYNKLRIELVGTSLSYEQIDKFLKATEKSKASTPIISLASAVAELRKNTSELSKAYDEMDESGSMSLQTMEDLLKVHPELQDSINIENGLITISKDLLKSKFDEEKKIRVAELEANKISLESKREEIKEKIRLYGLELTAYQSLLQAYQSGGQQSLFDKAIGKKSLSIFEDGKTTEQRKLDLELKNTEEAIKKAGDSANKIKTLQIETSNKKKKEDPNREELKTSAKLLEADLYSDVNNEIAKYNSLINQSEGIVKNTKNLSEQNIQLKKQKELYEGLQKAIHAKAEVARKEKDNLVSEGKAFGFKFAGSGDDMTLENSAKIIADQKNKTDSLRNYTNNAGEDIYRAEEEKYQKMIKLAQRFFDISNKELFEYKNNYTDVGDKIVSDINKINANKIDILFTDVEKNASVFQKQLKLLDDQEKSLDEADFTGKKALKMKELSKVTAEVLKNNGDLVKLSYEASLEGINNTEEYINRREKLSEVFIENKNKMEELKKEILDTDKEAQKSAEELAKNLIEAQKKSQEIVIDNKKDELSRESELKEKYFTEKEWENEDKLKALENDIFGGKQSDYENAMKNKVDLLKDQSDIMQEQEDSLEKQKDLSQKLLDIEKAKKELLNTQNEKNSRLYTGKGFDWVANPKAVRDAQENVSKLQEDYDGIQQKQAKEKAKKEIQNQINTAQKVYDEKKDSFDKQKDVLTSTLEEERKTWSRSKQMREWAIYEEGFQLELSYRNIEGMTRTYLDNLKKIYGEKWTEIIGELTSKLSQAKALNESLMALNAKNTSISISSSSSSSGSGSTTIAKITKATSNTPTSTIQALSNLVASNTKTNTPQPSPLKLDSGGYTGNNEGLAMLHKKELVLNENDTKNILHSVYANRNTVDPISNTVNNSNTNSGTVYNLNNVKIVSENADQLWKNIKGYADKKR